MPKKNPEYWSLRRTRGPPEGTFKYMLAKVVRKGRLSRPKNPQKREDLVPNACSRGSPEEERSGPVCKHQRLSRRGKPVTIFTVGSWFDGDVVWWI